MFSNRKCTMRADLYLGWSALHSKFCTALCPEMGSVTDVGRHSELGLIPWCAVV